MSDIGKGEELVFDYTINGFNDGTFWCRCGSKKCRKVYQGNFFELPQGLQRKYLAYVVEWFKQEHKQEFRRLRST